MKRDERTRDIIDVKITTEETRHIIETDTCEQCKRTCEAENDLPKKGSYSKNVVGTMAELRASQMTDSNMALFMKNLFEIPMAKSTVVNVQKRIAQSMDASASDIYKKVAESSHAHMDETPTSFNGITMWIWLVMSGDNISITISKGRGSLVLDGFLEEFGGILICGKYGVYMRVKLDDYRQLCWAHEILNAKHAKMHGVPKALCCDLVSIYEEAKRMQQNLPPSAKSRRCMENVLRQMLSQYRDSPDEHVQKVIKRLDSSLPSLFTFLEHKGVEPTNNRAEQALRYPVIFRKISGALRGRLDSVKRMSDFLTCVMTCESQGKSVAEEVAAMI